MTWLDQMLADEHASAAVRLEVVRRVDEWAAHAVQAEANLIHDKIRALTAGLSAEVQYRAMSMWDESIREELDAEAETNT